jgi:tRNA dimethylallyltransferase
LHDALRQIDPEAADRISANDAKRIIRALEVYRLTGKPISSFQKQFDAERPRHDWTIIGLRREKAVESHRINARVKKMVELGLADEVKSLLAEEEPLSQQARCAIGYAEIISHLEGRISLDDAIEEVKKNTRHLAKGQPTWFKTFRHVTWLDVAEEEPPSIIERASNQPRLDQQPVPMPHVYQSQILFDGDPLMGLGRLNSCSAGAWQRLAEHVA